MSYSAFGGDKCIARGDVLTEIASHVKSFATKHPKETVVVFDEQTSQQIEIDLCGSKDDVLKRLVKTHAGPAKPTTEQKAGPGRPKLGVVSKEVTLLPQHWDWLASQPGGASVTLRKLVDSAQKKYASRDQLRRVQDATYKFMTVMAGDRPHYEEALRAMYARDKAKFKKLIGDWPKDIRDHIVKLAKDVFEA